MVLGFTCSFFFLLLLPFLSPPPNLPAGILKLVGKKSPCVCGRSVCGWNILFPLLCRWFHQGLARFPPLFVARVWTYNEAEGEGGEVFSSSPFSPKKKKTKRQTRKCIQWNIWQLHCKPCGGWVLLASLLLPGPLSVPSTTRCVCVLHLIFVCVCVSSACVFVSASHSDSRCGVFHTTKLFDSGFPKVSEDIFFFPWLFRKVWWTFFPPLTRSLDIPERLYTVKNNSKKERERKNPTLVCLGGHCCV